MTIVRTARTKLTLSQRALSSMQLAGKIIRSWPRSCAASRMVATPAAIRRVMGFEVPGAGRVRSIVFSTDPIVIEHSDADAVFAVYPFPPSPRVIRAICAFSEKGVFCGVGGGRTKGRKAIEMAIAAEDAGAAGIVLNHPATIDLIREIRSRVSLPIISTFAAADGNAIARIRAGADVLNIAAGPHTAEIVRNVRQLLPDIPLIATGGRTAATISAVIASGADAVSFAPPTSAELFVPVMARYRKMAFTAAAANQD